MDKVVQFSISSLASTADARCRQPTPIRCKSDVMLRSGRGRRTRSPLTLSWIAAAAVALAAGGAAAHQPSRSGTPPAVSAADRSRPEPQAGLRQEQSTIPQGDHKHEDIETEFIFGFTEGSSIHAPGETDLKLDTIGEFGKRGSYRHVGQKLEIHTGLPGEINLAAGLIGDFNRIRGVPGLDDVRSRYVVSGGFAELRWRILDGERAPFGLTFAAEPSFGSIEGTSGLRGRSLGVETRLLFDKELLKDKVFGAFNVLYGAGRFRPRGVRLFGKEGEELDAPLAPCVTRPPKMQAAHVEGEAAQEAHADEGQEPCTAFARRKSAERSSEFGVSGALAVQAFPNVFLGAEVRYLRAYEGLALQRFRGEALFVGPTFYAKLSERVILTAAFSTQVAGHAVGVPGRLDLDNFSRHEARLRLVYDF